MHSRTSSGPTQRAIAWGLTPSKRVLYRRRAPSYAGSPGRSSGPRSPRARAFQSAAREGAAERDATEVGVAAGEAAHDRRHPVAGAEREAAGGEPLHQIALGLERRPAPVDERVHDRSRRDPLLLAEVADRADDLHHESEALLRVRVARLGQ